MQVKYVNAYYMRIAQEGCLDLVNDAAIKDVLKRERNSWKTSLILTGMKTGIKTTMISFHIL